MPRLLQIAQLGHRILRQSTEVVQNIKDPFIQALIEDMMFTQIDSGGYGLAAPQVYQPLRIIIVSSKPSPRWPEAPLIEPFAMIDPVIPSTSPELEKGWEGCFSLPGVYAQVPRAKSVRVAYQTPKGECMDRVFEGLIARVIQHENDHLYGTMFTDRVDPKELVAEKEFQRMVAGQKLVIDWNDIHPNIGREVSSDCRDCD